MVLLCTITSKVFLFKRYSKTNNFIETLNKDCSNLSNNDPGSNQIINIYNNLKIKTLKF